MWVSICFPNTSTKRERKKEKAYCITMSLCLVYTSRILEEKKHTHFLSLETEKLGSKNNS